MLSFININTCTSKFSLWILWSAFVQSHFEFVALWNIIVNGCLLYKSKCKFVILKAEEQSIMTRNHRQTYWEINNKIPLFCADSLLYLFQNFPKEGSGPSFNQHRRQQVTWPWGMRDSRWWRVPMLMVGVWRGGKFTLASRRTSLHPLPPQPCLICCSLWWHWLFPEVWPVPPRV